MNPMAQIAIATNTGFTEDSKFALLLYRRLGLLLAKFFYSNWNRRSHMSQTHPISYKPFEESPPHKHTKYIAGIVLGIIVSSIVGLTVGYQIGASVTSARDAYFSAHAFLTAPLLLYGNVSIGNLGTPRGIAFTSGSSDPVTSMTPISGNGQYHYQVYLRWYQGSYNVTIYYQDSLGSWQYCAATPRTAAVHTVAQSQNFSC